tara:strand:- start:6120 stop:7097 length:978 start_codon:yes stop_codon:yes gene_type:complete
MMAASIIWISAAMAGAMTALFGLLLFRRWREEAKSEKESEFLAAITRSYLRRVAGQLDLEASPDWQNDHKLAAVSHIHLLLRGGERDRLMQLAELDGLLRATLRRSRSWRSARRVDAIRLLQQFGSEACIARLREIFTCDRDYSVRLEAAFALASIHALPPPRETIRILKMFDRKSSRLDSALLRASAPHYREQLDLLLGDPMPHAKRALIIDALGWSEDASVLPTLERASKSDNPELRSAALRAAAKLGHPAAAEWVIHLLSDRVAFVRIQAANSCASLGLRDAIPQLHRLMDDGDIWVRLRSEQALDVLEYEWPNDDTKGLVV